jgi:hypothetical protein
MVRTSGSVRAISSTISRVPEGGEGLWLAVNRGPRFQAAAGPVSRPPPPCSPGRSRAGKPRGRPGSRHGPPMAGNDLARGTGRRGPPAGHTRTGRSAAMPPPPGRSLCTAGPGASYRNRHCARVGRLRRMQPCSGGEGDGRGPPPRPARGNVGSTSGRPGNARAPPYRRAREGEHQRARGYVAAVRPRRSNRPGARRSSRARSSTGDTPRSPTGCSSIAGSRERPVAAVRISRRSGQPQAGRSPGAIGDR